MSTVTLQRYRVTVALPRPAGDGALVPLGAQVLAEAAAAAVAAEDLMTAWTAGTTLLSMTVGSQCRPGALSAGWAVARALGGTEAASARVVYENPPCDLFLFKPELPQLSIQHHL